MYDYLNFNFYDKNIKMDLKYISRSGTKTRFTANINAIDQIELIMKAICFYTMAIFQTDSVEQKIFYKKDGDVFIGKITDIINKYFFSMDYEDIEPSSLSLKKLIPDDVTDTNYFKIIDSSHLDQIIAKHHNEYDDKKISEMLSKTKIKGAIRYQTKTEYHINIAMATIDDDDDDNSAYNFNTSSYVDIDCLKKFKNKEKETMGNFGAFIESGDHPNKEINMQKYVAFDFDQLNIMVTKINDHAYKMKCKNLKKLHHASSMWAYPCLVTYKYEKITDPEYVSEVNATVQIEEKDQCLSIETSYVAIECL